MTRDDSELANLLVGSLVFKMRRIKFEFMHKVIDNNGPLEIQFHNGQTVLFDAGEDGEELELLTKAWEDPFEGKMSQENREFVRKNGKWVAFDVSSQQGFKNLIGESAKSLLSKRDVAEKLIGLTLVFPSTLLHLETGVDELLVTLYPQANKLRIKPQD